MNTATELLRRMIGYLDYSNKEADAFAVEVEAFLDESYLAAEPEANEHSISGAIAFTNGYYGGRCTVLPSNPAMVIPAGVPLYTRPEPAIRKPMSLDECLKGWELTKLYGHTDRPTFIAGVRFAEKHHLGIGINLSDPDSIDLQSRCRGDKL